MKDKFTLEEALDLLEAYEISDRLILTESEENSCYTHDYDDYINETNERVKQEILAAGSIEAYEKLRNRVAEATESRSPAIGDIAILKVHLSNTKDTKYLYNGYERRPILIIRVDNNLVDGLEITHSETFNNLHLINIGKLGNDTRDSYVNIYTKQLGLDTEYEFPYYFIDGRPMTKGEFILQSFGSIYRAKDKDKPFLVTFDYKQNYKESLDSGLVLNILKLLEEKK